MLPNRRRSRNSVKTLALSFFPGDHVRIGGGGPVHVFLRALAADVQPTDLVRVPGLRTLCGLESHGDPLDRDHGEPARLMAPNRPGVLQTKWLSRLEVAA